jgi:hypothetical protein
MATVPESNTPEPEKRLRSATPEPEKRLRSDFEHVFSEWSISIETEAPDPLCNRAASKRSFSTIDPGRRQQLAKIILDWEAALDPHDREYFNRPNDS